MPVEASPKPATKPDPKPMVESRVWYSTHTWGPKKRREHHLAFWASMVESSRILVAPDVGGYLDQWEVGMRVVRGWGGESRRRPTGAATGSQ